MNLVDPTGLYECVKDQCDEIESFRQGIIDAREGLGDSKFDEALSRALGGILGVLGTKNDGNGLDVELGNLDEGILGNFDRGGLFSNDKITLDVNQIQKSDADSAAGVLAHELGHKAQSDLGLFEGGTPEDYVDRETQADIFTTAVDRGNGVDGATGATGSP